MEELVIEGRAPIQESWEDGLYDSGNTEDDGYICFMQNYIDATVYESGIINVLMYDTDDEKFYQISEAGKYEIEKFEE